MAEKPTRITYEALAVNGQLERPQIDSSSRLLIGIQRAFEKAGRTIPQAGTLVSLGCGTEPYLEALRIFTPGRFVGVDTNATSIASAQAHWTQNSQRLGFTPEFVVADAVEPSNVIQPAEQVHTVAIIHPQVDAKKNNQVDEKYRQMVKNWLKRLDQDGYVVITTYEPEEAQVFLRDPELQQHLVAYGVTDAVDETNSNGNNYILVLQRDVTTTEPARLLRADHYIDNELSDIDPTDPEYQEALRFTRGEARDALTHYYRDLTIPRSSRRKIQ